MRSLLSRLAFWWAAPAAALSLFLPPPLGSWVAAAAVLAAGLSLSLRALRRSAPATVLPDPADPVDELVLIDTTARIVRCTAQSRDLPEALHGVARILVQELGAVGLLTGRLDDVGSPRRAVANHAVAAQRLQAQPEPLSAAAGHAVAHQCVVCDPALGMAVPVMRHGRCVAWIEFESMELFVSRHALVKVLDLAHKELSAVAERAGGSDQLPTSATAMSARAPSRNAANDSSHGSPPSERGARGAPHPLLARYLQGRAVAAGAPSELAAAAQGFDPTALDRLRVLDPQGLNHLLERVARAFEVSTARLTPQLRLAAEAGDLAAVRQLAHTLQSSASSVGAIKLTMQCAEIETMSRAEPHPDLLPCVDALAPEIQTVMSVLRGLLGPRA